MKGTQYGVNADLINAEIEAQSDYALRTLVKAATDACNSIFRVANALASIDDSMEIARETKMIGIDTDRFSDQINRYDHELTDITPRCWFDISYLGHMVGQDLDVKGKVQATDAFPEAGYAFWNANIQQSFCLVDAVVDKLGLIDDEHRYTWMAMQKRVEAAWEGYRT